MPQGCPPSAEVAVDAELPPRIRTLVGDDARILALKEKDVSLLDDGLLLAQANQFLIETEHGVRIHKLRLGVDRVEIRRRREPEEVNAELLQVVELCGDAGQIAKSVAVRVVEGLRVSLVGNLICIFIVYPLL